MTVFQQFCERYAKCFSYTSRRQIGVEKEILVTDVDGQMAHLTQHVWPHLLAQGLKPTHGPFYKDEIVGFKVDGGEITTDAGKGTFEVILEPFDTLKECERTMKRILRRVYPICSREGYHLLGLGYQPLAAEDPKYWNRKQRYEILDEVLGQAVRPSLLGAADQAHIDIHLDEFVGVTNALSGLAGFLMALFSNSPVRNGVVSKPQVYREIFWDALGLDRTGIYERPWESMEDYLDHLWDVECIMANDEQGRFFNPGVPFRDFVESKTMDELWEQYCIHEGSIWFSARPRVFGTVEVRPICNQPWDDMLQGAAMIAGAVENWKEVAEFLKDFQWEELRQLRYDVADQGFGVSIKGRPIGDFLKDLLDIVEAGLRERHEDWSLEALYQRARNQQSPADRAIEWFKQGGVPLMVEKTSLREDQLLA